MEFSNIRSIKTPGRVPAHNRTIWRYMSFSKFIKFMDDRALYFSRLSNMTDIGDGRFFARDFTNNELPKPNYPINNLVPAIELREKYYVSCWSALDAESYALWKIYLGGEKIGFAIRTDVRRLRNAILKMNPNIQMFEGLIDYAGHFKQTDKVDGDLIYKKKKYYEFESEYRLSMGVNEVHDYSLTYGDKGVKIPVDLGVLEPQIYVSPFIDLQTAGELIFMMNKYYKNSSINFVLSQIQDS
jgi:hypothetical protein